MFAKLAAEILKVLEKRSGMGGKVDPMNPPPPLYLKAVTALNEVETFGDLLNALAALDTVVCAYVTLELSRYDPSVAIAKQEVIKSPASVYRWASVLFDAYRRVVAGAGKVIRAPGGDLGVVAGRIAIDEKAAAISPAVAEFLTTVHGFVLLSLWVASRSELGEQFVSQLAQSKAAALVQVQYKAGPASLLAFVGASGCYCTAPPDDAVPGADIRTRAGTIIKGAGGPSSLGAPVWPPEERLMELLESDKTAHKVFGFQKWGSYTGVDAALAQILSGSVSFTRDRAPFYTPPRIELLHELIHVLHNATGANREKVDALSPGERVIFKDAEEYWTIDGGEITENGFNALIGAPDRASHGGLSLAGLDPSNPAAASSFHELSGLGSS